jgi:hypothetical protein
MKNVIIAPCEKVIVDKSSGTPSLITIMQNINVQVPVGQEIPSDAVVPREWFIFTQWLIEENDYGKTFVQKAMVILPDGTSFGQGSTIPFTLGNRDHRIAQNVVTLVGMPIGQLGPLIARVWLEENGNKVTDISEYPLKVVQSEVPQAEKTVQ